MSEPDPEPNDDDTHLSFFDGTAPEGRDGHHAPDGSDQSVLPIALGAIALATFILGVMTVVTGGFSFLSFVVFLAAGGLTLAAVRARVKPISVEVVDGVVRVTEGEITRTFDLRNTGVHVEVQGTPDDAHWRVGFQRRALDPVDVDASMVRPEEFMSQLRQWRPDL